MESELIAEKGKIKNQELFNKMKRMMEHVGGDLNKIEKAYALDNLNLRKAFEASMKNLAQKHKDSPSLFKKRNWEELPPVTLRKENETQILQNEIEIRKKYVEFLNNNISEFREEFNDGQEARFFSIFFLFQFFLK